MAAAAQKARISAPVGQNPRPAGSEGKDVKNNPADVMICRKLLAASGIRIKVSKSADAGFVKAIKVFQRSLGFKYPDGVIDPNRKTFRTLVKRASKSKDAAGATAIDAYMVPVGGKKHPLSKKDYERAVAETCKKLQRIVVAMRSHYETVDQTAQFYIDAATGASGFMDALVSWASSLKADIPPPYFPSAGKAHVLLGKAEGAVKAKNISLALDDMKKAQKAINAYAAEVQKYGNKICGGAKDMQENLELVRDTSFEIAGYIASAYLVARGTSPTAAKAGSGAVFGMIKSASTQYGRSLAGYDDSLGENVATVLLDGVVGGVKGGLSAKYVDKFGDQVATKIVSRPPFSTAGKSVVKNLAKKFMEGAGKQAVTEAFEGVLATAAEYGKSSVIKGKKFNWSAQLEKTLVDALFKVITAGLFKNVEAANGKLGKVMQERSKKAAKSTAVLKKLHLDKNEWFKALPPAKQAEHFSKVTESLIGNTGNQGLKNAWGAALDSLKGNEPPEKIAAAVADRALQEEKFLSGMRAQFEKLEKAAGKKK